MSKRKTFTILIALLIYAFIHEGAHAFFAMIFNEYQGFVVHPYGLEVIFRTPVAHRHGIIWGIISGGSNLITIILGYLLLYNRRFFSNLKNRLISSIAYWLISICLLFDTLNLSIVPFVFGGDIGGIVEGFQINRYVVQIFFFILFLINRELVIKKLLPIYSINQTNIFWRPIFKWIK